MTDAVKARDSDNFMPVAPVILDYSLECKLCQIRIHATLSYHAAIKSSHEAQSLH